MAIWPCGPGALAGRWFRESQSAESCQSRTSLRPLACCLLGAMRTRSSSSAARDNLAANALFNALSRPGASLAPSPPPKAPTRVLTRKRKIPLHPVDYYNPLVSLPTECLVEVLRYLEIHELLEVAWTCRRMHQAARDSALWSHTHFSIADWRAILQRHFVEDRTRRTEDHTGTWTRCVCSLTQVTCRAARACGPAEAPRGCMSSHRTRPPPPPRFRSVPSPRLCTPSRHSSYTLAPNLSRPLFILAARLRRV